MTTEMDVDLKSKVVFLVYAEYPTNSYPDRLGARVFDNESDAVEYLDVLSARVEKDSEGERDELLTIVEDVESGAILDIRRFVDGKWVDREGGA